MPLLCITTPSTRKSATPKRAQRNWWSTIVGMRKTTTMKRRPTCRNLTRARTRRPRVCHSLRTSNMATNTRHQLDPDAAIKEWRKLR
jgi:hypothetical protein